MASRRCACCAVAPAAGAKVPVKGSITMVIESEPDTIVPKDATTDNAYFVMGNVYDALTARDWSSGEPKIVGKLAESYTQQVTEQFRQGLRAFFYSCLVAAVGAVEQHSQTTKDGMNFDPAKFLPPES